MLVTKKVFIDTEYFIRKKFNFEIQSFSKFQTLCEMGELEHITTPVIIGECKSNLREILTASIEARKKFLKTGDVLLHLGKGNEKIQALFAEIDDEEIYSKAEQAFDVYIQKSLTSIISVKDINGEELIKRYFEALPPFGKNNKKFEFPDAVTLLAIQEFLQAGQKVYIVSQDSDLRKFCEEFPQTFVSATSLEKVISLHQELVSSRFAHAMDTLKHNTEAIRTKIKDYFETRDVWNNSTWDNSRVDDPIKVIEIGEFEPDILFADDYGCDISIDVEIEFEVTVIGPDYNNSYYDREDKKLYVFDETQKTVPIRENYTVLFGISYDLIDGKLDNVDLGDVHIEEFATGIEVEVDENDPPDFY